MIEVGSRAEFDELFANQLANNWLAEAPPAAEAPELAPEAPEFDTFEEYASGCEKLAPLAPP